MLLKQNSVERLKEKVEEMFQKEDLKIQRWKIGEKKLEI